jgi:nucleoside phosphorylase
MRSIKMARNLRHHDYTVAWVCALPLEMATAKAMLDEIHPSLPTSSNDQNTYILGRIYAHNVVIACLPSGAYGTTSAATVATQMLCTFRSIRFGLMVGIGGGAPSKKADIRLGDVVVSEPTGDFGGVVQYDFGKTVGQGVFERTGRLNRPPQMLLTAIARLQADQMMETSRIPDFLIEMMVTYPRMRAEFTYRGQEQDRLFDAAFDHHGSENTCDTCEISKLVTRPARDRLDPVIHYGLIASGNQVIRHGGTRDKLGQELGILCFEMGAAGLMDNFPCLVIRGICDYADSHKNEQWQGYAAATAAAYAKELLSVIHPNQVEETPVAVSVTNCEISTPNGKYASLM